MQNINNQILTNMAKNDILKTTNVFVPRIYGYIGKGKIGCFLYGLVPMGNHAVCQKGGNRYERLTRLRNMVWFCTFQKRKDGIK